jgi:predicted N-acetyltransferase YhbS
MTLGENRKFALELIEESGMTPATDVAIRALLCRCFSPDTGVFSKTRYWHGSAPVYSYFCGSDTGVTGHVGVVVREVLCGGEHILIAGIQNLAVAPEMRKQGLSQQLMTEAMKEAARRGIRFGLLFCVPELERFYLSLGWVRTDVRAMMIDENGDRAAIPPKNIAMCKELAREKWPGGEIDLCGADW